MSGIERGGQLRFLTLTSSKDSPDTCQKSFRALYMRLKRRGLMKGYIKVPELSKSGKQHLHVLFRGSYIEQAMISQWWQEIHGAKIIDIRRAWQSQGKKALASYMAKYMSKDNYFRYSWNWDWVWRGFCKDWHRLKVYWRWLNTGSELRPFSWVILAWRFWLKGIWTPPFNQVPETFWPKFLQPGASSPTRTPKALLPKPYSHKYPLPIPSALMPAQPYLPVA
jgi:hypothetical protein